MITVSFTLSMPGVNSWNGKWSGDEKLYAVVKTFREVPAREILDKRRFSYSFGDGWIAAVTVAEVDKAAARRIKKLSAGFCGYDWMIDSIIRHGSIKPD